MNCSENSADWVPQSNSKSWGKARMRFPGVAALAQICIAASAIGLVVSMGFVRWHRSQLGADPDRPTDPDHPPPPRHAAKLRSESQLYVAVVDTAYSPAPYHCLMKRQWMDDISRLAHVDGVEFYSTTSYEESECQLRAIGVPDAKSFDATAL
jgi:hypothetical protein